MDSFHESTMKYGFFYTTRRSLTRVSGSHFGSQNMTKVTKVVGNPKCFPEPPNTNGETLWNNANREDPR